MQKDEIKENIWFRLHCDSPMSKKYGIELGETECKILLDYITNLQEENEKLKEDKKKVLELIENDYFEDGSFENEYIVKNILNGGDEE